MKFLRDFFTRNFNQRFAFFLFLSALLWVYLVYFHPRSMGKIFVLAVGRGKFPITIGSASLHGKICPLTLRKIFGKIHGDTFFVPDKFLHSGKFSVASAVKEKMGFWNILNGVWKVQPDSFSLFGSITPKDYIKKKVCADVKILNPYKLFIARKVFIPESVYVSRMKNFNASECEILPAFLYSVQLPPDTHEIFLGEHFVPSRIKFYIQAEPFILVRTSFPIKNTSGKSLVRIPDSVLTTLLVPKSYTSDIKKYIYFYTDTMAEASRTEKKIFAFRRDSFLHVLSVEPSMVREFELKNSGH